MLDHPVALVTGASRGIGRGIALRLAELNHAVVVNFVHNSDQAQQVVDQITSAGGKAFCCRADVSISENRQELIEQTLKEFGRVDLLVNNAGITSPGRKDLLEADEAAWDQVFAVNLKGPFFLAQAVAREMIRLIQSDRIAIGRIINISSVSAFAFSTDRTDYCLTKAALGAMTELLAARLAEEKILVHEICPGVIATDMTAPVREKYEQKITAGLSPIRRWGTPEDVAQAVAAIVQGYFPFSTGQRFHIDGGFHIRRL